jgi:8-oxo-dGTP pyrophosphatase MutT (NUDIX family)
MNKLGRLVGKIAFWLSWPGSWFHLRNTRRVRIIVTSGGEILMVRAWFEAGDWGLPGGGIKRGEEPLQAAQRELREETGLQVEASALQFVKEMPVKEYGITHLCVLYRVTLPNPIEVVRGREIQQAAWRAKDSEPLSPTTRRLLAEWS